jgi:hypothetical protein
MLLPLLLSVFGSASGVAPEPEPEASSNNGKYKVEHAMSLAEIGSANDFKNEHASAFRDIMDAGV